MANKIEFGGQRIARTAFGSESHVATIDVVTFEGYDTVREIARLRCGTAISYRFRVAAEEATPEELRSVTCSKCNPSAKAK